MTDKYKRVEGVVEIDRDRQLCKYVMNFWCRSECLSVRESSLTDPAHSQKYFFHFVHGVDLDSSIVYEIKKWTYFSKLL